MPYFRENGLKKEEAHIHNNLGNIYNVISNDEKALIHYNHALDIYKTIEGYQSDGLINMSLGVVKYNQGKFHEAIVSIEEAIQIYEKRNNIYSLA